jgi:hypothetical protein
MYRSKIYYGNKNKILEINTRGKNNRKFHLFFRYHIRPIRADLALANLRLLLVVNYGPRQRFDVYHQQFNPPGTYGFPLIECVPTRDSMINWTTFSLFHSDVEAICQYTETVFNNF